jgi:uncharacterized protein (UPF0332 family)
VTDENRKKNIALEVARGREALRAAEMLLAGGLLADAVSRAYYAAYHFARALLLTGGEEPRTHGGVDRLLQRDFVRTGTLGADVALLFSRLQKYRQDADYSPEFVFTPTAATTEVAAARTFIGAVESLLHAQKWIADV